MNKFYLRKDVNAMVENEKRTNEQELKDLDIQLEKTASEPTLLDSKKAHATSACGKVPGICGKLVQH